MKEATERFFNVDIKKPAYVSDMAAFILEALNNFNCKTEQFIGLHWYIYSRCSELLRRINMHFPEEIDCPKYCDFLIEMYGPGNLENFKTLLRDILVYKQFRERHFHSRKYLIKFLHISYHILSSP